MNPLFDDKIGQNSYELDQHIIDNMLEAFQIVDFKWRRLYVNNALAKQLGKAKEDLLGHTIMEAYSDFESTEAYRVIALCMETRVEQYFETRFAIPDGTKKWFQVSVQPVPQGILILSVDITPHKNAEESLRESEAQFRLIAENIADMISVLDLNGKRMYSSPSFKKVLGDPAALIGAEFFNEIHHEDRDKVKQAFRNTIATGIGQREEYRLVARDGSIHFIESQGSVIRDENGSVCKMVVVSRDVTEQKQLEKQFLHVQRLESIGTLAGGIAHDLNNVLAPILLSLNVMKKKLPDDQSQKMLKMVEETTGRGADLIKQVLSFARGVEGARTVVQVRHLIVEIAKIIDKTFPKSIVLQTSFTRYLPTVSGDATQLHQVLMNLCVNARDAMPNGGTLEIKTEVVNLDNQYVKMHVEAKPGMHIVLTVTDTGTGMPPATLERIFEPFFTTKEVGKGTGLGLSTVMAIVKSHGGFVNVYSEAGKGTTFKVYIPALSTGEVDVPEKEDDIPLGNGEIILVVDDDATICEITKTTLEAYGYSVLTASDGTGALALYAKHGTGIHLIVTDMMMPYLDGPATIRALQKMNPLVKIIGVSGLRPHFDNADHAPAAFLQKPYTSDSLLKLIHKLLH